MSPLLQARLIAKRFGAFTALENVDFSLDAGQIHGLLGENGAGKSTLMSILSGSVEPSCGDIILDGHAVRWSGPRDAAKAGVAMVHQHFHLVPVFSVADNIALASQQSGLLLRRAEIERRASMVAERLGWRLPLSARAGDLPVGAQQRVEIVKALMLSPRIIFFDEPTAVLTPDETEDLFRVLRALRDEGKALAFVSHKLGEVISLCDRVTILRSGRVTGDVDARETGEAEMARLMVGGSVAEVSPASGAVVTTGEPAFQVNDLFAPKRERDNVELCGISFAVHAGEVLGIAGVDGNGQLELFEALLGLRSVRSGDAARAEPGDGTGSPKPLMRLRGVSGTLVPSPRKLSDSGVAWIPPDRHRQGLALNLSVERNLMMSAPRERALQMGPILRWSRLHSRARELMREFDIRAPSSKMPAAALSGGNQQKIVVARALAKEPGLLIAASPTRGLDVGAAAYVHRKLRESQERGAAILLMSTELDEILLLANRIAVMYEGRIVGIVDNDGSRDRIGLMMGGAASGAMA